MKLKTKLITSAIAAALGSVAGTAQAVHLGADNQGQVLLYPYFTVQAKGTGSFDTYISIVNSDSVRGKAVKVRFLEGKNSKEILDFNLYLSPNDVWTGTVTRNASGDGMLTTTDKSCTAPAIPSSGVSFVNYAYASDLAVDPSMARTREGYLEVIQMGDLISGSALSGLTFANSLHSGGVPASCATIIARHTAGTSEPLDVPTGYLSGAGTILNPTEGTDISYTAVALDAYSDTANHTNTGNTAPSLGDVTPKVSTVLNGADTVNTDWLGVAPSSIPVSAVLMRQQIVNEYAVAAAPVGLNTDWVITFPTKTDHVNVAAPGAILPPFTQRMSATGACEPVTVTAYDREEGKTSSGLQFSPTSAAAGNSLCWEANVVSINTATVTSNVLAGVLTRKGLTVPYTEGYLNLTFNQTLVAPVASTTVTPLGGAPVVGVDRTYVGLPMLGFSALSFVNTASTANFGGLYDHRYIRKIF
jgi:hypothetical protein